MKTIFAIAVLSLLPIYGFANGFPVKMPDDFKIMYVLGGGTRGAERTIEIDKDLCKDNGHQFYYQPEMRYQVQRESLETLYSGLRKINAFKLEFETFASYDSWGTTIVYTMNNEYYYVASMNDAIIIPEHREAFEQSVQLILEFTNQSRKYNLDHKINLLTNEIPDTMSNDFAINYYFTSGKTDSYTSISIQMGTCYYSYSSGDMDVQPKSFKIENRHVLEKLYRELKDQHAFTLWKVNPDIYMLGNEAATTVTYTIGGETYELPGINIIDEHKEAFHSTIQIILDFVQKHLNK